MSKKNKNKQKELEKEWSMVTLSSLIGIFFSIGASGLYDIFKSALVFNESKKLEVVVSVMVTYVFLGMGVLLFEMVGYIINNRDNKNSEQGFLNIAIQASKSFTKKEIVSFIIILVIISALYLNYL